MKPQTILTHRWQESGLGMAPFRVMGVVCLPPPSLAAANPSAYNNAMREATSCGVPVGTCQVCGQGIMRNVIIESSDNRRFAVGCDCAIKAGDTKLTTKVKQLENARKREIAAERREALRIKRLEDQRAKNGGLTNWELAEKTRAEAEAADRARKAPIAEMLEPVADLIADGKGGFCDSIANTLRSGDVPYGRGFHLTCDIIAKKYGRAGSKTYDAKYSEISGILEAADN